MSGSSDDIILVPGDTCWRIEAADRVSLIVDAARYFAALRSAIQQAQHCVFMIGWEFDTRISLDPDAQDKDVPEQLGKLLNWAVSERPDLKIYLLEWDVGMIQTLGRGSTPLRLADWLAGDQISLKLDHAHPSGAAHHQKIVVIDDVLAFCGGIDATADRWDTREHLDVNPLRKRPTTGRSYDPWHDATLALDGAAANALAQHVRDRWERATGETIDPAPATLPHWPEDLSPTMKNVHVAISRTAPAYNGREAVHEIEALYLRIIGATQHSLYIESQYFASRKLAEAIAARLREADPPEFVIINPESADGWLEEKVMGSSRARLLALIRQADHRGRFRLYTPVTEGRTPIYVHAKVVVMDDRLVRVGSSNLNNRSLGFDTECDLSIEAQSADHADADLRMRIAGIRSDLLAEHLGVDMYTVETTFQQKDCSLIETIEALRGDGRSLVPFVPPELSMIEDDVLRESDLLDPERPADFWKAFRLSRLLPFGEK